MPVLLVLLPLSVLMVELALEGFGFEGYVLEGCSEKVPLPWFGQNLL